MTKFEYLKGVLTALQIVAKMNKLRLDSYI